MQSAKLANTRFKVIGEDHQKVIEISFSRDRTFLSCRSGTDLADFDVLLQYFIPDIDLEKIRPSIARWWERELYRVLSKHRQQRGFVKAFAYFCEHIGKRYEKTPRRLQAGFSRHQGRNAGGSSPPSAKTS